MQLLIDILIPVFGLVAIGYGAVRLGGFDAGRLQGLSFFAFGFAIPALLLRSMATMEITGAVAWSFLLSYYLGAFAMFALGAVAGRVLFGRSLADCAIAGLGCSYSNTVLLGIPLLLTVFGERASFPVFLLVAFHSALMLPVVTTVLEIGQGAADRLRAIPLTTAKGLLRNPILIGLVVGLLFNALNWQLPTAVDSLLEMLGRAAVPCALFAMGGSLARYGPQGQMAEAAALSALKLLVHPLLVWLLGAQVFDLDPLWLKVAVLMAALPTGVNVYVMAQQYRAMPEVAASTVLVSTSAGILTLSGLLFLLA